MCFWADLMKTKKVGLACYFQSVEPSISSDFGKNRNWWMGDSSNWKKSKRSNHYQQRFCQWFKRETSAKYFLTIVLLLMSKFYILDKSIIIFVELLLPTLPLSDCGVCSSYEKNVPNRNSLNHFDAQSSFFRQT